MNGGNGGDAPPTGAVGPNGRAAGVAGVESTDVGDVDALLVASGAQEALAYGSTAATGANCAGVNANTTGVARAWESVALEGDMSAKRFKMDTSGVAPGDSETAASFASGSVALPPPLSMALGGGANTFALGAGANAGVNAIDANPMGNVLQQHLRQQQLEQQQRQRALQMQAQQQRLPFVPGQPQEQQDQEGGITPVGAGVSGNLVAQVKSEEAGSSAALYGMQPLASQPQTSLQGSVTSAVPMEQQTAAPAYLSGNELKFTIPAARTGVVQHHTIVSQGNQTPPQQQAGLEQQQQAQQQLPPPQQPVAAALASATPSSGEVGAPITLPGTNHPCLICQEEGGVFSCQGGCGLHAHPTCIGEDVIVQFSVGQLCGNCYIMQQDRNLKEDLTKGDAARLSVRRAILWVNLETNNPINFEKFGHMTSLRLWEIGRVAGYPIKPFAEKFVEPYLQRWMREKLAYVEKWQLTVHEVFTLLLGLYGLKCASISHDRLTTVIDLVKVRNLSVTDYIGWHPGIESPNVRCSAICPICSIRNAPELEQCARCHRRLQFPSVYMKYASAILAAFYAEHVGIPLGTTVIDVFAHTNTVRQAYKGLAPIDADGIPWEIFTDQLRMIFGLLDIMSDFGSLQLNPDLFGPEVAILFNASYVHRAILQTDFEIVGRTLQCMKLFGGTRIEAQRQLIAACEQFLLMRQMPNGCWCKMGGSAVDQYKATVACAKALATPKFRGYGPLSADCQRLLEKWADSFKNSVMGKTQPQQKSPAAAPSDANKLLVCGAVVKPSARANLKRLEAMYKRQLVPGKGMNTMEYLVSARMRSLASAKKLTAEPAEDEDEQPSTPDDEQPAIKSEGVKNNCEDTTKSELMREVKEEAGGDATASSQSGSNGDAATSVKHEDEEALTSRSLSEDLEIFDGLKFEDGDVIDLNQHASMAANADEDDGDTDENADGDAGQGNDDDDIGDDDMYDDDNEENDDGSGSNHSGDDDQGQPEPADANEGADEISIVSDQVPEVPLDDSSAPLL